MLLWERGPSLPAASGKGRLTEASRQGWAALPETSGGLEVKRKIQLITLIVSICLACLYQFPPAASADNSKSPLDFDCEVRPILSDNRGAGNGPGGNQPKAKLRFDTKEGAFAKAGVITPGDALKSRLYQRFSSKDQDTVMPPPSSEHKLTEKQIETIRRWIDEGARWDEHWAFVPPKRPEIPKVTNAAWVRNPIDSFILARLEKEGLKPQREADKTTLLRRVYLDLTGLPPTPADVDAF